VDGDGRIGPMNTVFLDTLIDENAASHLALGSGIAMAVSDDEGRARMNSSRIHIDLMVGSLDVDADGITGAGEHVPVLRRGVWAV
jgi:aminopeptidase